MKLHLDLPSRVALGDLAIGRIRMVNDGPTSEPVTNRFHLHEGDLTILVDGVRHVGAELIDSYGRFAELGPGEVIAGGVSLVASDHGLIFGQSGRHEVSAELAVGGHPTLTSDPAIVEVAGTEPTFTVDEAVALSRGQIEPAEVATDSSQAARLIELASAIRAEGWPELGVAQAQERLDQELAGVAADELPWLVTALLPPAPLADDPLVLAALELLGPDDVDSRTILAGQPFAAES